MRARVPAASLFLMALTNFSVHGASNVPGMLEIGRRKQLFIDDYMIQSLTDAQQVLNTAVKERRQSRHQARPALGRAPLSHCKGPLRRGGEAVQDVVQHHRAVAGRARRSAS